jgi:hypothetical protein
LELETLTKFFEKNFADSLSVQWHISLLNKYLPKELNPKKNLTSAPLVREGEKGSVSKDYSVSSGGLQAQDLSFFLATSLKSYNKEFFFKNGIAILTLTFLHPKASLLAKFMGAVMEDLPKGQMVIDFIGQGLGALRGANLSPRMGNEKGPVGGANPFPLKGSLVKVKGRINGSERSRTSAFRYGSIPLHTIDAYIDYGFATTHTSYGASSIKVWLKA